MTPRGRRPGDEDTRERILTSARRLFAQQGYERASMRVIARAAGVDPSLIVHYFGSKQGLLEECLQLPLDPRVVLSEVSKAPPEQRGDLLVRALVAAWERPEVQQHLLGMLRTGTSHDTARQALQRTLHDAVQPVVAGLAIDDPARRSALVMSQLAGLAITRYFLRIPEVVALTPDEIIAAVGPTVQRYLTGSLG
jgi:AcrR family transcriptional regulator